MKPFFDLRPEAEVQAERLKAAQERALGAKAVAANPLATPQMRRAALVEIKAAEQLIQSNPITRQAAVKANVGARLERDIAKAGIVTTSKPGIAPAADALSFVPRVLPTAPAAPVAPTAAPEALDPATFFSQLAGGPVKMTSGKRDPVHNAEVGGVKNSMHLSGEAQDFVPPPGANRAAIVAALKAQGFTEALDEGDHIHAGWRGAAHNPFGMAMPTLAAGDTTHAPGVAFLDPQAAMSMIPTPRAFNGIDLPNAPQQELPAMLPMLQEANAEQLLAPVKEAAKVAPINTSDNAWDRFSAFLQGAAGGAAGADPRRGLGQLLLLAGAGGLGGFTGEKKSQKAEQEAYDERVRQVNLMLAKAGFDINLGNVGTRNTNLDRGWTSGENVRKTKFSNAESADARRVQELLANNGISNQNIAALNATDQQRASVGISASQNAAGAQNAANSQQVAINANGTSADFDKMILDVGFDPKSKSPMVGTARTTAAGIKANNPSAALLGFAQELVSNGGAQEVLAPDQGDTPEAAAAKAQALRALKSAKKATDPGVQEATQLLASMLNSDHKAALQVAQMFASRGYPSAGLILKYNNAPVK